MILGKYQKAYGESLIDRGYSSTVKIQDDSENYFFAKWIKGIKKDSTPGRMLVDRLRRLKKNEHKSLPKIHDYGWDEIQGAYCMVFEHLDAQSLEESVAELKPAYFLKGIEQLSDCLQSLIKKDKLTHGDINPANILLSSDLNFYLVDFGIADAAASLSQHQDLEIFARRFAAPEKTDRNIPKGFAFHSDIFSLGKVIEWYFEQKQLQEFDAVKSIIDGCCQTMPEDRFNFELLRQALDNVLKEISFESENLVIVNNASEELLVELNDPDFQVRFDVSPSAGSNILFDIITRNFWAHALWVIDKSAIEIRATEKDPSSEKYKKVRRHGLKPGFPLNYKSSNITGECFNLTPFFKKLQKEKQFEADYRSGKRKALEEIKFYEELLQKEKDYLLKNSLRIQYKKFEKQGNNRIHFHLSPNEKLSRNDQIYIHIDQSTPPNPIEFEYILSPTADTKQIQNPPRFIGTAFTFDKQKKSLSFKDCDGLDFDKIPKEGYIFQNIRKEEEEKNRQLDALRKVKFDEVQNRDLINYIFNPQDLSGKLLDVYELEKIFQNDDNGIPFQYSSNQTRAIINALYREPISMIQGPPGTGKTTVITEIVFQLLHAHPGVKILITSQTNDAVDNVLENLLKKKIAFVRLSGEKQPKESLQAHTLENKINNWKENVRIQTKANWKPEKEKFKNQVKNLNADLGLVFDKLSNNEPYAEKFQSLLKRLRFVNQEMDWDMYSESESELLEKLNEITQLDWVGYFNKQQIFKDWLSAITSLDSSSKINQKLIDSIRVIGATTNHIAARKYSKYSFDFDYVIMDESGKATTAEALIPLVMANKAILVGDHRQLRPMLTSSRDVEKWLREKFKEEASELEGWDDYFNRPSLFEQVIEEIDNDFKSQLEVCRRSAKDQVELTSKCFYEPYGDDPILPVSRPAEMEHNLDLKVNSSIIFLEIGSHVKSKTDESKSSYNSESARLIPEIICRLDHYEAIKNYTLGVIVPYKAQLKLINKEFRKLNPKTFNNISLNSEQLVVSVVDRFQGLEKDIIIFDLVRCGQETLGFLSVANRLNVALSRQKRLLIIIGNRDSILNARVPKELERKGQNPAITNYIRLLKEEWIVNHIDQIF